MAGRIRIMLLVLCGLAILLVGFAPPVIVRNRQISLRQKCFSQLITIDHSFNCGGLAPGPAGTPVDPKTVPFDGWRKAGETETHSIRNCPCGPAYQADFRVGAHPLCPVHGDLVGKSGLIHHERGPDPLPPIPFPVWGFVTASASLVLAIATAAFGLKKRRERNQTAHPATAPYSEPAARTPQG